MAEQRHRVKEQREKIIDQKMRDGGLNDPEIKQICRPIQRAVIQKSDDPESRWRHRADEYRKE